MISKLHMTPKKTEGTDAKVGLRSEDKAGEMPAVDLGLLEGNVEVVVL